MGFDGYPQLNDTAQLTTSLKFYDVTTDSFDVQGPLLLRGIEWISAWLDSTLSATAVIYYNTTGDIFDSTNFEHLLFSWDSKLSAYIFLSIFNDLSIFLSTIKMPFFENWYNFVSLISSNIVYSLEHPEVNYIYNSTIHDVLLPAVSSYIFITFGEFFLEQISVLLFHVLDIIWKLGFLAFFLSFIFNWYNNSATDNNVDSDFLVNSLTIESEEEIASIEDTVVLLAVVLFVFGWFFFFNYLLILTALGEVISIFIFLPVLFYILLFIPIYLLWDYGMYFLTYLRGAGSTSSLAMEFIYDCIAFLAFFIRLGVQNVRLLLITLTFFSLYEFILFYVNANWFNSNFDQLNKLISTSNGMYTSYYYFLYGLTKVVYWTYELLHTFFVTVAQFVAFFAMVFWLFLFLYTMFVVEEFEKYLDDKRKKLNDK